MGLWLAACKVAPEHTHQRSAFEQRQIQGQGGDGATGETHHQITAAPGDGAEGGFGEFTAHGVVNHIRPFAFGQGFECVAQVFGAVVDGGICTQGLAQGAFFIGRCRCDHFGAHGLGDLNGRRAHAPGSAQHQHGFSCFEGSAVHQGVVRSGIGHDEGGGIHCRKACRQGHAQLGGGQGVGAKTARARQAGHSLTDFQMRHAFAHGFDHAGVFRARHKGQLRLHLVFVLNDQQVWEVQAGGLNFQQNLARRRGGGGQFFPGQRVNACGVFAKPCVHSISPDERVLDEGSC